MQLFYGDSGVDSLTTECETDIVDQAVGESGPLTFVGDSTIGSPTLLNVTPIDSLSLGQTVTGPGIPANTTIIGLSGTTVTLSANATATNVGEAFTADGGIASGPYVGAVVMLFTAAVTLPAKAATVASLVEAAYMGYARSSAIIWSTSPPLLTPAGNPLATGDRKQFRCTGASTPADVTGAAIIANDGTTVLQVCPFGSTVGIQNPGDGLDFVPVVSMVPTT